MAVPPSRDPRYRGYPPAHQPARTGQPIPGGQYPPAGQYPPGVQAPQTGAQGTVAAAPGYPGGQALWTGEQRSNNKLLFTVLMCVVGGVALLVALGYIALATGVSRTSVAFVLALVPLAIVLLGVRWLDRWEPEPKPILAVALVWGAGVAVLSALIVNTTVQQWLLQRTQDPESTAATTAVFVAPVVEETVKGAGVVLLYIFRRQHMDGPVDGVVYAATVAAGFAFTENVLYFAQYTSGVGQVFLMRGVFSPFAHALFTSCIGIAVGLAARSRSRGTLALTLPLGLVAAMVLHGLWNGSAVIGGDFVLTYIAIHVPLFACMVGLLIWLRRQEAAVIRERLTEYSQAGWFAPHEVVMLASLRLRSQAKAWAVTYGEEARDAMRTFQYEATRLAFLRQRVYRRKTTDPARERALLEAIGQQRAIFAHAMSRRY